MHLPRKPISLEERLRTALLVLWLGSGESSLHITLAQAAWMGHGK